VCGKPAQPTLGWQIDDNGLEWNIARTATQRTNTYLGYDVGSYICGGCNKQVGILAREAENVPPEFKDLAEYDAYNRFNSVIECDYEFYKANKEKILDGRAIETIRDMIDSNIDYMIFRNWSEHYHYSRVSHLYTLEKFRKMRPGGFDYPNLFEKPNLEIINFIQTGSYGLVDYGTRIPFNMHKLDIGSDGFKIMMNHNEVQDKPDLHHFVTLKGVSILKGKVEPSAMIQKGKLQDNRQDFIESFGIWAISNTIHKRFHSIFSNFDIDTAEEMEIMPFWAQSETNYNIVRNEFPGLIDEITLDEMINLHRF
jgi:hypothetical protein